MCAYFFLPLLPLILIPHSARTRGVRQITIFLFRLYKFIQHRKTFFVWLRFCFSLALAALLKICRNSSGAGSSVHGSVVIDSDDVCICIIVVLSLVAPAPLLKADGDEKRFHLLSRSRQPPFFPVVLDSPPPRADLTSHRLPFFS